jgi:hypothetical protein
MMQNAFAGRGPPEKETAPDADNVEGPKPNQNQDLLLITDRLPRRKSVVLDDWPADYAEQFWRRYPRRVAKLAAMKALERVRKSGQVNFPDLLAAVEAYADSVSNKDMQFICHAASWLNAGRWLDDPAHLENTYYGQGKISSAEGWANRRRADLEGEAGEHRPRLLASNTRSGS